MGYQVTIYSEAERAERQRQVEQYGKSCGDMATYHPAHRVEGFFGGHDVAARLSLSFQRPETNLTSQKDWIEMLAAAVQGCHRQGSQQRGLSKEEFLELAKHSEKQDANNSENGWSIPMNRGYRRGIKAAELKALKRVLGWG